MMMVRRTVMTGGGSPLMLDAPIVIER